MTQQELQQFISPYDVNKGYVVEGDQVEFELKNNSPFEYQCFESSCGCFGELELLPNSLKVSLKASATGQGSTYEMLKIGNRYAQLHNTPQGPRFYDPMASVWIPNEEVPEAPEKAAVFQFYQTITLWMEDGLPIYDITPQGQLTLNASKSRIVVPVKFLIIKKLA